MRARSARENFWGIPPTFGDIPPTFAPRRGDISPPLELNYTVVSRCFRLGTPGAKGMMLQFAV